MVSQNNHNGITSTKIAGMAIFALSMLTGSAGAGTLIFEDSFNNDLANWTLYGQPRPALKADMGNPLPGFDNQGDASYASGGISTMSFNYSNGLIIESDIYINDSRYIGCWVSADFGIASSTQLTDTGGMMPAVGISHEAIGPLCWMDPDKQGHGRTRYYMINESGQTEILEILGGQSDLDLGSWHTYRIYIRPDMIVEFFKDGNLIYTTTSRISMVYNNKPVMIAGRSHSLYGPALHDNVKVFALRNVTRTLPVSVVPGETFDVNIAITNVSECCGYEIEETIPSGFTFVSTTAFVNFTNSTNPQKHRFIQNDNSPFNYTLTASTTIGTYAISGTFIDSDLNTENISDSTIRVVQKPLILTVSPSSVTAYTPTNVTFNVSYGGTVISNATITLSGKATGIGTTNDTGIAIINVTPTDTGIITATASKTGYTNKSVTISSSSKKPAIIADTASVTAFTPTDVYFNISYGGSPVIGATVTLTGKASGSNTTNDTGIAIINVTATGTGVITATVSMAGNYTNNTTTITALPKPLNISANPINVTAFTSENVYFNVTYAGSAVINATVTLTGRASGSNTTNDTGITVINVTATGDGTIIATASKTNNYTSNTTSVTALPKYLEISVSHANVTALTPTNVTFNLTYEGAAVSGARVSLTGKATGGAYTNDTGIAVINISATSAGVITATASKTGYTSNSTSLTVLPKTLDMSVSTDNVTAFTPMNVTFNVTYGGSAIENATITLGGNATGSSTTNDTGIAIINVTATGAGSITATASKTGYTSNTTNITALPKTLDISASPANVTAGNATNVTFNVTYSGSPVPGATVTLTGRASGSNTTNDTGIAVINLTAILTGTITATASMDNYTSGNVSLTVDPYSPGVITRLQMCQAVADYMDGLLTREQVIAMLVQYFNGG